MINLDGVTSKAVVAWLSCGHDIGARVSDAAKAARYLLVEAPDIAAHGRFDVAVVDLRGAEQSRQTCNELLTTARRLAPVAGVIILVSTEADEKTRATLRRRGDLCFVDRDATPAVAYIRERLRLYGLVDEMGERLKSIVADGRTASFFSLQHEKPHLSVLVAGAPSPLTLSACNAVRKTAAQATCVFTAGQVMRALDHSGFDGAVFLPETEGDLLFALARALRRHRDYRNIPVILASADQDLLDRFVIRDGFDTIQADHIDADLSKRLGLAARRARTASAVRNFLRSNDGLAGGKDGAASARFFAQHATRLFRRADETGEAISFAAYSLSAREAESGAIVEAIRTASRILRAEDLIARLSPATFAVLLRGVREHDARRIAERLEGVISGSLPRATTANAERTSAAVQRHPGEDVEETIAALFRALKRIERTGAFAG
ncbi:MAG: hypothetical protein KDE05_02445 [Parvularculaceae bacterium]|nr:hypothetical protein [Parvularculaceae bacterium]